MRETITISLPKTLKKKLDLQVKQEHINRSDIVREALRDYFTLQEFRRLRAQMIPFAEKRGIYTDEDVFRKVS